MAQSSQLSRSQIAVLAVTGVAAACGIYVLYDAFSDRRVKSPLRRSNAIRSRHTSPPSRYAGVISSTFLPPDDTAPLGRLFLQFGNEPTLTYNLAQEGVPVIDHIAIRPDIVRRIHVTAVECVLTATQLAVTPEQQQYLTDNDLLPLAAVISNRDVIEVHRLASSIRNVLSSRVSLDEVREGISNLSRQIASGDFARDDSSDNGSHELTFADTDDVDGAEGVTEPSQGFKGLLYHIAETDAKRKAYEHRGIHCEDCGERPIRGVRWHCLNCPDYDLCSTCEANTDHQRTHVFVKIKVPLPVLSQPTKEYPLWYPGDPRKYHVPLNPQLRKDLGVAHDFSEPQMDAHYDQFVCIANVPWYDDPTGIKAAIDRRAFNKALTSEQWPQRFRPNALYDRMFAFYDTNCDGLIGFDEFLSGLAYLRGPNRFEPLDRALQGFDLDGDGYVDRVDFLRLFRAKFEIQKLLINTMIECRENEQTNAAMETLRSSLPISSVFVGEDIPPGEERPRTGKVINALGDLIPADGTSTIIRDDEGWPERRSRESQQNGISSDVTQSLEQRVQTRLSRQDEIMNNLREGMQISSHPHYESQPNSEQLYPRPNKVSGDAALESHAIITDANSDVLEAVNETMLRQIIEDGFHEMLDPLFKETEDQDREAIESREERSKWRKEIDSFKDSRVADKLNPLMETYDTLFDQTKAARELVRGIVPTDRTSLARREAEIAERTLEELLDVTGYSVNESGDTVTNTGSLGENVSTQESEPPISASLSNETDRLTENLGSISEYSSTTTPNHSMQDPTMPQNRPDSGSPKAITLAEDESNPPQSTLETTRTSKVTGVTSDELPPARARLKELGVHDRREKKMEIRRGPGRLNYREIEELVKADPTNELKGLVTGWLEWASF